MNKKGFKTSANSARAGAGLGAFGRSATGFGSSGSSTLSYIQIPPDYSSISDSNVVVAFKNLAKKDATTKAKALEDLQAHISSTDAEIEAGVLDAWVKLFPRLSIDSSRRVRQLAFSLNGQICSRCGKRTVKYLPKIAGPWLAGTYDTDRSASRAAQDSLGLVFTSPEKVLGLRKSFHGDIIEFCKEAVLNETIQTLSDERSVSADDASATYARVVANSLALISSLLDDLSSDVEKHQDHYDELFGDSKLWAFATYTDPSVRRSMHRLVLSVLKNYKTIIETNLTNISTAYIYKGLTSDQTGSAADFVRILGALTTTFPTIWTDAYTGKKPAASRLRQCLKRGSQASNGYWEWMNMLIRNIPSQVLQGSYDDVSELLLAARDGVTRKEERNNASQAWPTYFMLVDSASAHLSEEESAKLMDAVIMPLFRQYLQPSPDTADWSVGGTKTAPIIAQAMTVQRLPSVLATEWPSLASKVVEAAKMSQPEQSKEFEKSQAQVAVVGERWAELQRHLFEKATSIKSETLIKSFETANISILDECIKLLDSRGGKPFGAAAIISDIVKSCGSYLLSNSEFKKHLEGYLRNDVTNWISTPSRKYILRTLYAMEDDTVFLQTFNSALQAIVASSDSNEDKLRALQDLLPPNTPKSAVEAAKANGELQSFIQASINAKSAEKDISCFSDLNRLGAISSETVDVVLANLTESLSVSGQAETGLSALELLSRTDGATLKAFMDKPNTTSDHLLPSVLQLEQSKNDAVAEKAAALSSRLSSAIGESSSEDKYGVVVKNLEKTSGPLMPLDGLIELTDRLLGPDRKINNALEVLPSLESWESSLSKVMRPPKSSMALLSSLGGALHLVSPREGKREQIAIDSEGFSQPLRIGMFVAKLLSSTNLLESLQQHNEARSSLFALLYLTVLLAEDTLSITGLSGLWSPAATTEAEPAVMDFIADANAALAKYWQTLSPELPATTDRSSEYSRFFMALDALRGAEAPDSAMHYYLALASSKANANLFELHGYSSEQGKASDQVLRETRLKKDTLLTAACIYGLQQPLSGTPLLNRFCNELVADLTDLDTNEKAQAGMEKLILLNEILQTQSEITEDLPKQRLIFLIKRLISSVDGGAPAIIIAEIWKTLSYLLPSIQEMFGEHWDQILSTLLTFWNSIQDHVDNTPYDESQVLLMHASLRLYDTMRKLTKCDEPNDDLVEALQVKMADISDSIFRLLKSENGVADDGHQPLLVTHEILLREIEQLPVDQSLKDIDELYPLLYAPSQPIQRGGFSLLHRQIPAAQEQISFDAALDDKKASLPDELLSLIMEAPTLDALADASFHRTMPTPLQGYLYSWRLFFDHFTNSSYRVKNDYIDQLKDGDYLNGLLDFTFDFLGLTHGRQINPTKFDIVNYTPDVEPTPEKDVQWLLIHLYFLALTHMPSAVKTYYLGIRARQTSVSVNEWTKRYISPLIVRTSLEAVEEWADKNKDDPDFENMTVKVSKSAREVHAKYLVDEQTMHVKVVLPEEYPLASAQVVGVQRVAVREEKWQSWLRNCQGVITFSNGSITDGLSSWRKNVTGALKGQTECAICYSLVSADKQLPSKRCPTCKNLFHSSCLFKWFKTSSASTCPLCRNSFNFN